MQNIRNFAIIAHVDHGKSTLADRLLETTGAVNKRQMQAQVLDSNPIERERGITIKLAPVRMNYANYVLNLIDTPGHVDFSYEVNRSLAACEGAVLLVDATQGIQAQTLAHYYQAKKLGLAIIPVINKIDITTADVEGTRRQIKETLNFEPESVLLVSGKTGAGVSELLEAIIRRIPFPKGQSDAPLRALIFNSNYDPHLGVVAWVRVVDGCLRAGEKLKLLAASVHTTSLEVGFFAPARRASSSLTAGSVGYVVTSIKETAQIAVGDTLTHSEGLVIPLPGYQPVQPVVFVSFYPVDGTEINAVRDALDKLKLQDSSLSYSPEFSSALGHGFRVGFLGMLHADVVQERLEREFGLTLIAVAPSVSYEVVLISGETKRVSKAQDMPDPSLIREIREPVISCSIFLPELYIGPVMQLCQNHRGTLADMTYLGQLVELRYVLPLSELIRGFYDQLKSASQGFATLNYEISGFQAEDLVKLDVLISGEKIDALSQITHRSKSRHQARDLVDCLAAIIPRAQFEISIQAAIGGHILARADVKAFRKDVTAKLSGGDQTRKDKLLKKQKKGKARMKRVGRVDIPQEAFLSILKIN